MDRALVDRLAGMPARLADAGRQAPTVPGEWTPSEVVRHLIAVEEQVWHPRIRQLATEEHPHWAWAEPDRWLGEPDAGLDRLLDTYRDRRWTTVELLTALDDAGWARTGTHDTYGVLDVAGLMERALAHDEEHLASLGAPEADGSPR
jgi:DinB superfamily